MMKRKTMRIFICNNERLRVHLHADECSWGTLVRCKTRFIVLKCFWLLACDEEFESPILREFYINPVNFTI